MQGQADSSNGPFGRGSGAGCAVQACLVRSSLPVEPADCHLMPCPRGALENVRLMPLEEPQPGPGEVKASSHLSQGAGVRKLLRSKAADEARQIFRIRLVALRNF